MVTATRHDPLALFGFALREGDWVLADLLAMRLARSEPAGRRLERELWANARRPGRPRSLPDLRRLAVVTRNLGLEEDDR